MARGRWPTLWWGALGAGLVTLAGPACTATDVFTCQTDDECVDGEHSGLCQSEGYCSFPDDGCQSGQRFGEHAGPLAGVCVSTGGGTEPATSTATSTDDMGVTSLPTTGEPPGTDDGTTAIVPDDTGSDTSEIKQDLGSVPDVPGSPTVGPCDDLCPNSCYVVEEDGYGMCTVPCRMDGECPPASFDGMPYELQCLNTPGESLCAIPCEGPDTCPEGAACIPLGAFMFGICMWPL